MASTTPLTSPHEKLTSPRRRSPRRQFQHTSRRDLPQFFSGETVENASLNRVIAHEMGHEVMGAKDDGFLDMNNVNENENPIALELGEPLRTE